MLRSAVHRDRCPPIFCCAKRLLTQKGASFEEIDVSGDWAAREALVEKAGGRTTVPQIWIGDTHVGGSDELHALDRAGKLDALLGIPSPRLSRGEG
jgi:glutaredoxin 3